MGPHTAKRRKLSHSSQEDDDARMEELASGEDGSFGGFEDEDTDGMSETEDNKVTRMDATPKKNQEKPALSKKRPTGGLHDGGVYTAEVYKSNMFKLQVDDLLEEIRPRHGKKEAPVDNALRTLKAIIEQIPSREPLPVPDAERTLIKSSKVAVPFPYPRPSKDVKYKLEYVKPASITVAGSYALKLATRTDNELAIDLIVTMPSALFQEKDFLNYRYFYKRAYYLACIAAGIGAHTEHKFKLSFDSLNGNLLQPVLVIRGNGDGGADDFTSSNCRINVMVVAPEGIFPLDKTAPGKNCVRPKADGDDTAPKAASPTPFYNATIRSDSSVVAYLKLLHGASRQSEAYVDATLLGRVWLRQRGFGSNTCKGGFGNFEWAALVALLLQGGGVNGKPLLSPGYSSYQLFKAVLQILAVKDLVKTPLLVQAKNVEIPKTDNIPTLFDGARGMNILYKMTSWSYKRLRQEAATSIKMLGDSVFDQFEPTFILRADPLLLKYDTTLEISISALGIDTTTEDAEDQLNERCRKLYTVLARALGDRVNQIHVIKPTQREWSLGSRQHSRSPDSKILVGFIVDAANIGRTVDHGPSAENKKEAASFRQFWGEKAELRRFKDGSILESLVWTAKDGNASIFQQIVEYILARHLNSDLAGKTRYMGDEIPRLLSSVPSMVSMASFQPLMNAFTTFDSDLRSLSGLPLSLRHVLAADASFCYSSLDTPLMPLGKPMEQPANVVIQFEGSTRWPDDVVAIQRIKIAFLLKIAELLAASVDGVTTRMGLENSTLELQNQGFLDIVYSTGAAFRLRIFHDREQTLLERQLKDSGLDGAAKEAASTALAVYKQDYLRRPAHVQAIQTLSTRYPALSPTIRLLKKWFSSHLLSPHIAAEVIELIAVRTFLQSYPWDTPNSPSTGFTRALFFLSRWDWRRDPLLVDFGSSNSAINNTAPLPEGALKSVDIASLSTRFVAWRKLDPALNRVVLFAASTVDPDGNTWTDHTRPAKVVAARMTQLAHAASELIQTQGGVSMDPASLFVSSTAEYDFVLYLNPRFTRAGRLKKQRKSETAPFRNLQLQAAASSALSSDADNVGYNPVGLFLAELQDLYGNSIIWFHDGAAAEPTVAALWNISAVEARSWKVKVPYSTVPREAKPTAAATEDDGDDDTVFRSLAGGVDVTINKRGILAEIARLGGDLVAKIDVQRM